MPSLVHRAFLDSAFVRTRRLELDCSREQIADAIGTSVRMVVSLERDENHAQITLGTLARLAEILGTEVHPLLLNAQASSQPPLADDARLEAALLSAGRLVRGTSLGRALGLTENQTRDAATRLRERLLGTGSALAAADASGKWAIVPRQGVLNDVELDALRRLSDARYELGRHPLFVLRMIIDGKHEALRHDRNTRIALGYLARNGYIRYDPDGGLRPTKEVLFSLGLTGFPPTEHDRRKTIERAGQTRSRG
jgi:transcriptional regulator with XRE-family HTH domain